MLARNATRGAIALTLALAGSAGAALAGPGSERVRVHPVDGGHWQGHVGLPDARGSADQALVRVVDGSDDHPEVAEIAGLAGRATGDVQRLGFTVAGDEAGIIPCIKVAFTDAEDRRRELMITDFRKEPSREPGWTVYRLDGGLPPGGTIEAIEIGVHVGEVELAEPVRIRFDDVVVDDAVFTHAGDASRR